MAKRELKFGKRKDGITVSLLEDGVEKGRLTHLPTREAATKAALAEWGHIPTLQMEAVDPKTGSSQPRPKKTSLPPAAKPASPRTVPPKKPDKPSKVWSMHPPLNCYCPEQRARLRTIRKGVEKE